MAFITFIVAHQLVLSLCRSLLWFYGRIPAVCRGHHRRHPVPLGLTVFLPFFIVLPEPWVEGLFAGCVSWRWASHGSCSLHFVRFWNETDPCCLSTQFALQKVSISVPALAIPVSEYYALARWRLGNCSCWDRLCLPTWLYVAWEPRTDFIVLNGWGKKNNISRHVYVVWNSHLLSINKVLLKQPSLLIYILSLAAVELRGGIADLLAFEVYNIYYLPLDQEDHCPGLAFKPGGCGWRQG